jgi:hypothetical protein
MTTKQKHRFKILVGFIFSKDNIVQYVEDRTSPEDPQKNLEDIKSEWYFEVGNTQHRLYVHSMLKLKHNSNYRLSNKKIRGVVEKILGKKVHFNASGTSNANMAWHQYITKQ